MNRHRPPKSTGRPLPWRSHLKVLLVSVVVSSSLGCATPVDPNYSRLLLQSDVSPPSADTLGLGDKLSVRVYHEDLGGKFVVSPAGTINFPMVGKVVVDGLTCSEVEDKLTSALKNGFLRNPSVSCSVSEVNSKKIYVFGEVKKPGTFLFDDNMSVIQAVTLAGGFSSLASPNNTTVVRLVDGEKVQARIPMDAIIEGDVSNLQLLPGDILFVPQSLF